MNISEATKAAIISAHAKAKGAKGGLATAARMTPKQLSERGKRAVAQREKNRAKRKSENSGKIS